MIRQLLTESLLVSLAGGIVGLVFATSTLSLLTTFVERFTSRVSDVQIDPRVLGYTLVLSCVTGIIFGTLPAMTSGTDLVSAVKQGSKGAGIGPARRRIQSALVVAQVAVSVVLLVGAGLLIASVYRLQQVETGYRTERVLSAEAFTNFSKYPDAPSQQRFYEAVLARLVAEPGVVSAAVTNAVPLSAIQPGANPVLIKGQGDSDQEKRPTADPNIATSGYFATLNIPVLEGRDFAASDTRESEPVMIINKTMTKYWRTGSPVGSQVSLDNGRTWARVVGVAGDVRQYGLGQEVVPQLFLPLSQGGGVGGRFIVRSQGDPAELATMLRRDIQLVDPDMPVKNMTTLEELRSQALETPKLTALLLTIFAALALAVTAAGIAGVIAISVSHRLEEFGVRMALGATRPRILKLVVGQGLRMVVAGLVCGVAASLAFTRVLSAYLFDTRSGDPVTLALVCLTFIVAGVLACLGPAWRATSVDPLRALRSE